MSALEASRAETSQAAENLRVAQASTAAAAEELRTARNEELRIARELAKIELDKKVAKERENYQVTFGTNDRWVGVDGDRNSVDLYVHEFTDFLGSVELNRDSAISLRDFIDSKIK